jgi:uncharacterized protein (DUF1778 family)
MATVPKKPAQRKKVATRRTSRVSAQITAEQKALLERAAAYAGHTVTEFIVGAITAASQAVVEEREVIRLTRAESEAFVAALAKPAKPNAKLRQALEQHRRSVRSF